MLVKIASYKSRAVFVKRVVEIESGAKIHKFIINTLATGTEFYIANWCTNDAKFCGTVDI